MHKDRERDRLTREPLKGKWSSHRLQAEIIAQQGRRQEGGRKPTVITGKVTRGTLRAWDRWLELHLEANPTLRPEISKELEAIKTKIAKIDELLQNQSIGA